jgi:DNA-directed RNA polymerase specialized sigma24 family protein
MSAPGSITELLRRLAAGDAEAAQRLWALYFPRLLGLAQRRLAGHAPAADDAEGVALSALASFFLGAGRGGFPALHDRDALWGLLTVITARKALDLVARQGRQKRGGGRAPVAQDLDQLAAPQRPPDLEAELAEECQRLIERLGDERLRSVAVWKLEGQTDAEIAQRLGCSIRTVERKVRLIRTILAEEAGL